MIVDAVRCFCGFAAIRAQTVTIGSTRSIILLSSYGPIQPAMALRASACSSRFLQSVSSTRLQRTYIYNSRDLNSAVRNFTTPSQESSRANMAPVLKPSEDVATAVSNWISDNDVMVFSKSTCPFCLKVKQMFKAKRIDFAVVELDTMGQPGIDIQTELVNKTGQKTVPNVFIRGKHIGGADKTLEMTKEGTLFATGNNDVDFDLVVIGGGSGGLSCAKEAAKLGWKVACCDFVKPSPPGTTWGLGGTCVNVGCIPKKLMHQASLLGESLKDAETFGWEYGSADKKPVHNWEKMVENIQVHIKSLNWGYKVQLREKKVNYLNELAAFKGLNTLEMTDKKGKKREVTASNIVVAVGGRPKYPDIPGAIEYGITSDDIFSLRYNPGSTLIVGASYIALECAGFLKGLGIDVTVMVRSIYLRGFDQQMAEKIGDYMEAEGVNFIRPCVPTKVEQVEAGSPGKVKVYGEYKDGTEYCNEFNTVVFAIGRTADTDGLNLGTINVKTNASSKKIEADDNDRSTVPNIYAIGDVIEGRPELTPVAIQAGRLLARRIIGASKITTDYDNVATTVFTPIEYGCVGLSEEDAIQTLGEDAVEVYHSSFWPLEWTVTHRPENACYAKLVVNKQDDERVVGFHYLGPNAGEITQAFAGMVKLRATMADFEGLVGIHPTCAEIFTTMSITKSSGIDASASGC